MKATVREGRAMGSRLRLTLPGASTEDQVDAAWRTVVATFGQAERTLTRFDAMSALSRLNIAVGSSVRIPRPLSVALTAAWRAFRMTHGRFDPRVIGAREAAGERASVTLPRSPSHLDPSDRWLVLDARRCCASIDALIDLGGIGKGLALRWACHALERAGYRDVLVGAGGDLVARGAGPGGRPWIVGLQDPTGGPSPLTLISLTDQTLATSSTAVRTWTAPDGMTRHHLIDPATMEPATSPWLSVTVRHPDPAWAEVMSKELFLGGEDRPLAIEPGNVWRIARDGGGWLNPLGPPTR